MWERGREADYGVWGMRVVWFGYVIGVRMVWDGMGWDRIRWDGMSRADEEKRGKGKGRKKKGEKRRGEEKSRRDMEE